MTLIRWVHSSAGHLYLDYVSGIETEWPRHDRRTTALKKGETVTSWFLDCLRDIQLIDESC